MALPADQFPADSALESRHMHASRAAPISAIPVRSLDISSEGAWAFWLRWRPRAARRPRAVSSGDMSRNGKTAAPAGGWLDGDQQRAWLAYIRVQLRLAYEMNRQLLTDSGMSLADYDVLTALSVADRGLMPITVLAAQIGWERSRVSHHVRRMSARGLVTCGLSAADRRVTEVTLTARGWQALEEAAPGHVDLVRRLFFEGLPDGLVGPLSEALESVYANIIKLGSLPPPVDWHPAEG
jgi:DNA-binding MarR family transcriptional regulator